MWDTFLCQQFEWIAQESKIEESESQLVSIFSFHFRLFHYMWHQTCPLLLPWHKMFKAL